MIMSVQGIQDKKGNNIIEGDFVYPRFRGGSHEGKVGFLYLWRIYGESFACARSPYGTN